MTYSDDFVSPIPYKSEILFYYDQQYGQVPEEVGKTTMSIPEATGTSKEEWDALSRDDQDQLLDEAHREWLSDRMDSGWEVQQVARVKVKLKNMKPHEYQQKAWAFANHDQPHDQALLAWALGLADEAIELAECIWYDKPEKDGPKGSWRLHLVLGRDCIAAKRGAFVIS